MEKLPAIDDDKGSPENSTTLPTSSTPTHHTHFKVEGGLGLLRFL